MLGFIGEIQGQYFALTREDVRIEVIGHARSRYSSKKGLVENHGNCDSSCRFNVYYSLSVFPFLCEKKIQQRYSVFLKRQLFCNVTYKHVFDKFDKIRPFVIFTLPQRNK